MNRLDSQRGSPLWYAASEEGKIEFIQLLVAHDCDLNEADAKEKLSPLQVYHTHYHEFKQLMCSSGSLFGT